MKTSKDFYALLGIAPSASQEEIRKAYLSRSRVIHPDRFDPTLQPGEWKKANEMLAELNEAYETLSNPDRKRQHDDASRHHQQKQTSSNAKARNTTNRTGDRGGPKPLQKGSVNFNALPHAIQAALVRRQNSELPDQFKLQTSSTVANYFYIAILMGWFCFLVYQAPGDKWKDSFYWYGGISLAAGLLLAANTLTLLRTMRTTLHSYFYVTPLYFIDTEYDIVNFRPIWSLEDVSVTHNYKNGSYQSSSVALKYGSDSMTLTIPSKEKVEVFFQRLKGSDERARAEADRDNMQFFIENDYFCQVDVRIPPANTDVPGGMRAAVFGSFALASLLVFTAAYYYNKANAVETWVKHPEAGASRAPVATTAPRWTKDPVVSPATAPVVQRIPEFTVPEQPLPFNGSKQVFDRREAVAPFEIRTSSGSNYLVKLVNVQTNSPSLTVFVRGGMSVEVTVPVGTYEVRYASGDKWYGYSYLFGPTTSYSKADKNFDFQVVGNKISGYTITLYRVANGNLHTSSISPESF